MSKVRLTGSTSGYTELQASAVAGANTMTLPAATGIVDHLGRAGNILQVVSATTSTSFTTTSTTYADTNLTATITPTSSTSKVLVLVNQQLEISGTSRNDSGIRLVRGSTTILTPAADANGPYEIAIAVDGVTTTNQGLGHRWSIIYLDSPATTSATTYKTQGRVYASPNYLRCQTSVSGSGGTSTITLLEIAA